MKTKISLSIALMLSGCGNIDALRDRVSTSTSTSPQAAPIAASPLPQSVGEQLSGYSYIPIDSFPVESVLTFDCERERRLEFAPLLNSLPDNNVRMLAERTDVKAGATAGASKVGVTGETYRVTVDYINADTVNFRVGIANLQSHLENPSAPVFIRRLGPRSKPADDTMVEYNVPLYVGVGLRASAQVYIVGATANISGIGIIGAEAEANNLRGSLVMQTLGINSKAVSAALPLQSELNRTTATNAIVAVASVKTLLHSPETITSPRVVGMYLPFPATRAVINQLISEISKEPIQWERQCTDKVMPAEQTAAKPAQTTQPSPRPKAAPAPVRPASAPS